MPFNQLLLPLIGGYFLINFTYITSYWASRQGKEQFLFAAAGSGFLALIIGRILAILIMLTDFGPPIWTALHQAAPYPGIGTAVLAFFVCVVSTVWINWFWPKEEAALWLYGTSTYNSLERLFFRSVLRVEEVQTRRFIAELLIRMFWHPIVTAVAWLRACTVRARDAEHAELPELETSEEIGRLETADGVLDPVAVMLSMKDRKVYVGWLEWIPPLRADGSPFLRMVPAWSGYRDPHTLKVVVTERYSPDTFASSTLPPSKVISIGDIANASLYDPDVFERFREGSDGGDTEGF
jgi:hypothetical protein